MFGRAKLDFRYAVLIDQSAEREPFNPSDPTNGDVLTSGQVNMFKMGLPAHSAGHLQQALSLLTVVPVPNST